MSYEVLIHPKAIKFLKRLPESDVKRIKQKISELVEPYSIRCVKVKRYRGSL